MREVWILNHYAQAPGGAGGTRHFHLAEHLKKYGWNVTIIASSVEHGTGRQRLSPHEKFKLELIDGVNFVWIRTPAYVGNGFDRIINIICYSVRVLFVSTTVGLKSPDVIIGSSVHPLAPVSAYLLAGRFHVPFIFEVRDLWPQTLIDFGRLSERAILASALRLLERWLYKRADHIIVLLPKAHEYIIPLGIDRGRISWIPNGVDVLFFGPMIRPSTELNDFFTLMYFGSHGQANCLEDLIAAMHYIQKRGGGDNIKLRLIGDGPRKQALMDEVRRLGLTNISFEKSVPKKFIPKIASEADAFVVSVLDRPNLYRYGISFNKLFDYFAAGRPILIASSAANNPVEEADAGVCVKPGDPKAMGEAIINLAEMPLEERIRLGVNGRRFVEEYYGFDQLALKLGKILDEAIA